ncbi:MAG: polysaccharide export protein [Lysobacter sp.]|nr:polysaccharide export protein [Lysobacter sp.]
MHRRADGELPSGELPLPDPALVPTGRPEYRIGPNDLLNVVVFQVQDLERDVRVNNAGEISLPLVGTILAGGKSVQELQNLIAAGYGARFLEAPQVSVFVKEFSRQRVTVEGAVGAPGIYPIETQLSLLQAIALARGPTNVADERDVIVFRTVGGKRHIARFDLRAIRDGSAVDPEVLGEDVVVVAESGAKAWFRRLIEVTPLIGVWSVFRD